MEVEIIKIKSEGVSLDPTRQFGVTLKKIILPFTYYIGMQQILMFMKFSEIFMRL